MTEISETVGKFGHALDTGRAAVAADQSSDDLAQRRNEHVRRGIFRSPSEAPPKCEPNGGDRTMLSYRCPRPECAALPVGWGTYAEPRAWGIDRDFTPEDTWCRVCGTEGELQHVESAQDLLKRQAPELFGGSPRTG